MPRQCHQILSAVSSVSTPILTLTFTLSLSLSLTLTLTLTRTRTHQILSAVSIATATIKQRVLSITRCRHFPQHTLLPVRGHAVYPFILISLCLCLPPPLFLLHRRALQMPAGAWLNLATYNCGLTHFVIRPSGSVSVYGFGDIGYLPLDKVTYH